MLESYVTVACWWCFAKSPEERQFTDGTTGSYRTAHRLVPNLRYICQPYKCSSFMAFTHTHTHKNSIINKTTSGKFVRECYLQNNVNKTHGNNFNCILNFKIDVDYTVRVPEYYLWLRSRPDLTVKNRYIFR